jgi:SAM-dependent methyltransferase
MELYDRIHYPLLTHSYTHPDRLAVVGRLMGLMPADAASCSVLELGCGSGVNIIAMAELLPGSRFVGIDYSQGQIEAGKAIASRVGVTNVELQAADVLDLPDAFGRFDYIIAHGFYSWVPNPVRQKAMRLIKHSLAPRGIAFVSFNAYPGWHQFGALREMMLYRTRDIADPAEKVLAARAFVAMVAETQSDDDPFGLLVREYSSSLHGRGPMPEAQFVSTLIHDELAEINQPFYISQFIEHVNSEGLDFLAEADLEGSTPVGMSEDVLNVLNAIATSRLDMEQYMDFMRNRLFRKALLCHADAPVSRTLSAGAAALSGLYVGSAAGPQDDEAALGGVNFVAPDGLAYSTDQPLLQSAFQHLAAVRPDVVLFEDLLAHATAAAGPSEGAADALAAALLRNYLHGRSLVHFHTFRPPIVTSVSERPRTTAFARFTAGVDIDDTTNVRHERITLTTEMRALLPFLDGEHDFTAILEGAKSALVEPVTEVEVRHELQWLARTAMLLG